MGMMGQIARMLWNSCKQEQNIRTGKLAEEVG
jgi:hypothetical protein